MCEVFEKEWRNDFLFSVVVGSNLDQTVVFIKGMVIQLLSQEGVCIGSNLNQTVVVIKGMIVQLLS